MKYSFLLIGCFLLALGCSSPKEPESSPIDQLAWLEGKWIRTNDDRSKITYEEWVKESKEILRGKGFTVSLDSSIFAPDTIFMEQIRVLMLNDTLTYEVSGVHDTATSFKFIEQTDSSFVCVNPRNDFPKKISYTLDRGRMTAIISGRGPDVILNFRRE